ncbi:MAG: ribonuclease E/G [Butyrivibrio sp.]|nr:ribonuclease E/G [Butyrivibrio sp.]
MAEIYTSTYKDIPIVTAYVDGRMEYLSVVSKNNVGNIYLCRVDNIVKNIGSAFVRFKDGETGYVSLKNINPSLILNRDPQKFESLKAGDEILLQMEADAIKTKKAKMSPAVSISGKYSVVTLGRTGVGASLKIPEEKRKRLIAEVKEEYLRTKDNHIPKLRGSSYGVIIRTESMELDEDIAVSKISSDIEECISRLSNIINEASSRIVGSCVYENRSEDMDSHISRAKGFLKVFCPEEEIRVIEDNGIHGISSDMDKLFHNRIWLKSGAFLIIEQLESFNAIDVNTGKAIQGKENITEKVNLEAAEEIMRQIRLRNLTGMILIDFINTKNNSASKELISRIKELALKDVVHTEFIDITGLGIMELTRNKNNKSLRELF